MDEYNLGDVFCLKGKVAVITGGGGILCGNISRFLAQLGVKVAILDLFPENAQKVASQIKTDGGEAEIFAVNVLDSRNLQKTAEDILRIFGQVDFLINGAGGNKKEATTGDKSFFDLDPEAIRFVVDLNFLGTLLPTQIFGKYMVEKQEGVILNISSMNALRPLTRIPAYSASKAAVSNFTQWLAVHVAQEYSPKIRVNAIAPGFFMTEQNQYLLTDPVTGELTERGRSIISHTPAGRFGCPDDLMGVIAWLLSPASAFVTGIVIPVDGGFSAFSGV